VASVEHKLLVKPNHRFERTRGSSPFGGLIKVADLDKLTSFRVAAACRTT
jgi:hypothetical protein